MARDVKLHKGIRNFPSDLKYCCYVISLQFLDQVIYMFILVNKFTIYKKETLNRSILIRTMYKQQIHFIL